MRGRNKTEAAPVTEEEEEAQDEHEAPATIEELDAEAGQQAAFNPETGEINWDCPCLGGMAHGPWWVAPSACATRADGAQQRRAV